MRNLFAYFIATRISTQQLLTKKTHRLIYRFRGGSGCEPNLPIFKKLNVLGELSPWMALAVDSWNVFSCSGGGGGGGGEDICVCFPTREEVFFPRL